MCTKLLLLLVTLFSGNSFAQQLSNEWMVLQYVDYLTDPTVYERAKIKVDDRTGGFHCIHWSGAFFKLGEELESGYGDTVYYSEPISKVEDLADVACVKMPFPRSVKFVGLYGAKYYNERSWPMSLQYEQISEITRNGEEVSGFVCN